MKTVWIALLILMGVPLVLLVAFYSWATSGAYAKSRYAEIVTYPSQPSPSTQDTFTVVSYNIGYLSGLTNNLAVDRSQQLFDDNLATAIAALKAANPDFIGLQEIDINARRSYHVNQVEALATALGYHSGAIAINWDKRYVPFPYLPISTHFRQIVSGQAVLSRYPIQRNERMVLEKVANKPFFYNALYLDRLAQVTEIAVNDQPLVLINVHLEAFDEPTRRIQTESIKTLIERYVDQAPVLLIGDFNSVPPNAKNPDPTIQRLLEMPKIRPAFLNELVESDGQSSDAPAVATFPSDNPTQTLDYIFYTPDSIEPLEWRVMTEAGQASDHLPILMRFRLK